MAEPDHGRLITLNISFQEYSLLTFAILSTIYPFFEKTKRGGKLTDEEDSVRVALESVHNTVNEQARSSTSQLSGDRIQTNINYTLKLREFYQGVLGDVLEENIKTNFERITRKK